MEKTLNNSWRNRVTNDETWREREAEEGWECLLQADVSFYVYNFIYHLDYALAIHLQFPNFSFCQDVDLQYTVGYFLFIDFTYRPVSGVWKLLASQSFVIILTAECFCTFTFSKTYIFLYNAFKIFYIIKLEILGDRSISPSYSFPHTKRYANEFRFCSISYVCTFLSFQFPFAIRVVIYISHL